VRRAQFREHPFLARRDIADQEFGQFRDERPPGQPKPRQPQPDRDQRRRVETGLGEDFLQVAETGLKALMGGAQLAEKRNSLARPVVVGALGEGYSQGKFQSGT